MARPHAGPLAGAGESNENASVLPLTVSVIHGCDRVFAAPTTALKRGWKTESSPPGTPPVPSAPTPCSHCANATPCGKDCDEPLSVCTIVPPTTLPAEVEAALQVARFAPQSAGAGYDWTDADAIGPVNHA